MSGFSVALLAAAIQSATPLPSATPTPIGTPTARASPAPSPSGSPDPPPLPPCQTVRVATIDYVTSATAKAGDSFRFKTITEVPGVGTHPSVPVGSVGYAIVIYAHHNGISGKPGFMLVDARFVQLPDGTDAPVVFFPDPNKMVPILEGQHANAPGFLGFIPYASVMTGTYNTLHRGREITVQPGTQYTLVVWDDLALGKCSLNQTSRQQAR